MFGSIYPPGCTDKDIDAGHGEEPEKTCDCGNEIGNNEYCQDNDFCDSCQLKDTKKDASRWAFLNHRMYVVIKVEEGYYTCDNIEWQEEHKNAEFITAYDKNGDEIKLEKGK